MRPIRISDTDSGQPYKSGVRLFTIFPDGFGNTQGAQRIQRKQQLSVPSTSSVVDLLCHNQSTRKKLKSHTEKISKFLVARYLRLL